MRIFDRMARPFIAFVERYYPDPFVFAILLSLLGFLCAVLYTNTGPVEAAIAWGDGLPGLLAFMAQLCLTLLTAHALAHTDWMQSLLRAAGRLPRTARQACALVALISGVASLVAWSLGLVAGAVVARQTAIECARRGITVHYPLLVAAAYGGFVVWHMGYSGSAALFVATPGHAMESVMGVLPVTRTIFSPANIALAILTILAVAALSAALHPPAAQAKPFTPPPAQPPEADRSSARGAAKALDDSRLISFALGAALAAYLIHVQAIREVGLTLNIVNWSFLAAGLLLARSPYHYVRLIQRASASAGQILLQYPLYAGLLAMMSATGLTAALSDGFAAVSTEKTLPLFTFLSAGLLNIFVPSGGGQWAIQGPIFIKAAEDLGVEPELIVLAVSYGDQWTNMVQPFWTIPLLALAGLGVRDIMGYTFVIFLATFVLFAGGLLLMA